MSRQQTHTHTYTYTRRQPHAAHRYTLTHTHTGTDTQTTACGCYAHSSVLHYRYFMTEVHFEQIPFTLLRLPFAPPPFSNVIRKFKYIYTFFSVFFFCAFTPSTPFLFHFCCRLAKRKFIAKQIAMCSANNKAKRTFSLAAQ